MAFVLEYLMGFTSIHVFWICPDSSRWNKDTPSSWPRPISLVSVLSLNFPSYLNYEHVSREWKANSIFGLAPEICFSAPVDFILRFPDFQWSWASVFVRRTHEFLTYSVHIRNYQPKHWDRIVLIFILSLKTNSTIN